jgi:putative phosphoesterase
MTAVQVTVRSDTHLRGGLEKLPPQLLDALGRADAIVHAGDVVSLAALGELRSVAETDAVLGDNDHELAERVPGELRLELAGVRLAVLHDSGPATGRATPLYARFPDAQVVVFGHRHVPWDREGRDAQLLFNPGSPTQRRAQPSASFGRLTLEDGRVLGHAVVHLDPEGRTGHWRPDASTESSSPVRRARLGARMGTPSRTAPRRDALHAIGGPPRRRPSRRVRRRRRTVVVVLAVLVALVVWLVSRGPGTPRGGGAAATHGTDAASKGATNGGRSSGSRQAGAPRLRVTLEHWQLPNPLSREGAVALGGGRLLVLGGLGASGTSSTAVAVVDTSTGSVTAAGTLTVPTHDAGVSALGADALVFGGGQGTATTTVQAFPLSSGAAHSATTAGQLPLPRADDAAVTMGASAYVVGGYDGTTGSGRVLATKDGSTFTAIATLPVAVRYPAVAAAGGLLYVFGGAIVPGGTTLQAWTPTTRPPPGQEVPDVQVVDPASHRAWVAGRMPQAVEGAAAFTIGGHLYLAGGNSAAPGTPPVSVTTIWSYDPRTATFSAAGHLAQGVAYAGVAVDGTSAWLLGGEHDGTAVSTVQRIDLPSG